MPHVPPEGISLEFGHPPVANTGEEASGTTLLSIVRTYLMTLAVDHNIVQPSLQPCTPSLQLDIRQLLFGDLQSRLLLQQPHLKLIRRPYFLIPCCGSLLLLGSFYGVLEGRDFLASGCQTCFKFV